LFVGQTLQDSLLNFWVNHHEASLWFHHGSLLIMFSECPNSYYCVNG
jgi:hypothetical protein